MTNPHEWRLSHDRDGWFIEDEYGCGTSRKRA